MTAGEKKEPAAATNTGIAAPPFRPLSAWTGERFIFIPRPKASQADRYDDFSGNVSYAKYVGKTVRVVSVTDFSGNSG
ncbi:MAG TPA: hypothetical protein VNQ79_19905 [Blastocatellia bacterium]|nr:hypothetical protein [Blastocatellia bacterium]